MNKISNVANAIISNAREKANEINTINDGDYIGEDGLYYCFKCNTRKQKRLDLLGQEKIIMVPCQCKAYELDKQETEEKEKYRQADIDRMKDAGFQDSAMKNWTFENDDGKNPYVISIAKKFVENVEEMKAKRKGLLLFGGVGVGKTYASACIANALIEKGYPCLVTNFPRLIRTMEDLRQGRQDFLDNLNDYQLLVIDDLATERNTEYMQEFVFQIIDARQQGGLPLIVTTNLTSEELKNPQNIDKKRIYSRLMQMCVPIEINGVDRRKTSLINEFGEFAELLGLEVKK